MEKEPRVCDDIQQLISARVDRGVSPTDETRIKAHLARCSDCGSFAAFLSVLSEKAPSPRVFAPSPELFQRIASTTYARPSWTRRFQDFLRPVPARVGLAGGALAAACGVYIALRAPNTPVTAPIGGVVANRELPGETKPALDNTPGNPRVSTGAKSNGKIASKTSDGGVSALAAARPRAEIAKKNIVASLPAPEASNTKASNMSGTGGARQTNSARPVRSAVRPARNSGLDTVVAIGRGSSRLASRASEILASRGGTSVSRIAAGESFAAGSSPTGRNVAAAGIDDSALAPRTVALGPRLGSGANLSGSLSDSSGLEESASSGKVRIRMENLPNSPLGDGPIRASRELGKRETQTTATILSTPADIR